MPQILSFQLEFKFNTRPGRQLGVRDVGDLGELSPSFSSPSFRVGPICISQKLGDIGNIFQTSLNCWLVPWQRYLGCAALKGILFWTSSLAKGILFGNFSRV